MKAADGCTLLLDSGPSRQRWLPEAVHCRMCGPCVKCLEEFRLHHWRLSSRGLHLLSLPPAPLHELAPFCLHHGSPRAGFAFLVLNRVVTLALHLSTSHAGSPGTHTVRGALPRPATPWPLTALLFTPDATSLLVCHILLHRPGVLGN